MRSQIYRFFFADRLIRLLYYLPMERMSKEVFREEIPRPYSSFINELEKENKNLKLIQETNEKQIQNDIKERDELREENKKLKSDLAFERTMLDNVRAEYESSQNVIKKLKKELSKYKKQYEHSMGEDDELIYEEGLYD